MWAARHGGLRREWKVRDLASGYKSSAVNGMRNHSRELDGGEGCLEMIEHILMLPGKERREGETEDAEAPEKFPEGMGTGGPSPQRPSFTH